MEELKMGSLTEQLIIEKKQYEIDELKRKIDKNQKIAKLVMKKDVLIKMNIIMRKLWEFYDYLESMNDFFMILRTHIFNEKPWFRDDLLNESIQNFRRYLK